tara:strand:+ start:438 stop:1415 length:978 start_codon:yes stop_codon:yes gene_type:complete
MATYREVKGYSVKSVSSDPANVKEGQIWYNSSTKVIKVAPNIASWASGNNMSNSRSTMGFFGSATSAISAGGPSSTVGSEEYDGTNWTAGGNLNTGRNYIGGAGASIPSGRLFGGRQAPTTQNDENESYNGTSWSEEGDMNTARGMLVGMGTQAAALGAGGNTGPGPSGGSNQAISEEWDGSSWSEGDNLNTPRAGAGGAGTQTAGLCVAGQSSGVTDEVEEYNGTSWTSVTSIPAGREGMFVWGTQTDAVVAAGAQPRISTTFSYDGTNWTTYPATVATSRNYGATGGANSTAGVIGGGEAATGNTNLTEEFSQSATTRTVDVS